MPHFSMSAALLLADLPPEGERIMLIVNLVSIIIFVILCLFIFSRSRNAKSAMDKSLEWIETSNQHLHRVEQFMALQEKQGARIVELLESIDSSLKRKSD